MTMFVELLDKPGDFDPSAMSLKLTSKFAPLDINMLPDHLATLNQVFASYKRHYEPIVAEMAEMANTAKIMKIVQNIDEILQMLKNFCVREVIEKINTWEKIFPRFGIDKEVIDKDGDPLEWATFCKEVLKYIDAVIPILVISGANVFARQREGKISACEKDLLFLSWNSDEHTWVIFKHIELKRFSNDNCSKTRMSAIGRSLQLRRQKQ